MISKTLFSHYQQTLKLGLPISIGQIGTIVLSFADTMMVGRYDTPSLAAASFVNSVFNLAILLLIGYSFGLTPQVGALFGQGETASVGAAVRQALRANSLFAALLMLIMGVGYFFVDRMGPAGRVLLAFDTSLLFSHIGVDTFRDALQRIATIVGRDDAYEDRHVGTLGRQCAQYIRQLVAHLRRGPLSRAGAFRCGLVDTDFSYIYRHLDLGCPTLRALLQALSQRFFQRSLRLVRTTSHQRTILACLDPDGGRDGGVYVLRRDGRMDWKSRVGGLPSDHDGEHTGLYVLL